MMGSFDWGFPSSLFFGPLSVSLAFLTCSAPVVICFFFLLGLFEIGFLLDFDRGFVLVVGGRVGYLLN